MHWLDKNYPACVERGSDNKLSPILPIPDVVMEKYMAHVLLKIDSRTGLYYDPPQYYSFAHVKMEINLLAGQLQVYQAVILTLLSFHLISMTLMVRFYQLKNGKIFYLASHHSILRISEWLCHVYLLHWHTIMTGY